MDVLAARTRRRGRGQESCCPPLANVVVDRRGAHPGGDQLRKALGDTARSLSTSRRSRSGLSADRAANRQGSRRTGRRLPCRPVARTWRPALGASSRCGPREPWRSGSPSGSRHDARPPDAAIEPAPGRVTPDDRDPPLPVGDDPEAALIAQGLTGSGDRPVEGPGLWVAIESGLPTRLGRRLAAETAPAQYVLLRNRAARRDRLRVQVQLAGGGDRAAAVVRASSGPLAISSPSRTRSCAASLACCRSR
jgi:hypothetical protein